MGSGYHSKSPEELRQYLQSLSQKPRKRNWMQYLIFANIMGVMFVMLVIFQDRSLGIGNTFKASNKIQIDNLESYFTKSNESNPDSITYFLFIQNKSSEENVFPKEEMQVLFILSTDEKEECLQKKIISDSKKLNVNSTEFFSFTVNETEIKKSEGCDTFFHKIETKSFTKLFSKGNRKFTPEINLIYQNQIHRMSIQD